MRVGKQAGSIYLMALLWVFIVGIGLSATARLWSKQIRQQQEQELIFVGQQYMRAIALYYHFEDQKIYPQSLDLLIRDNRASTPIHHLRRLYKDPLTNSHEWGTVLAADGGISGIYSLAPGVPLKKNGFPVTVGDFSNNSTYQGWIFKYRP